MNRSIARLLSRVAPSGMNHDVLESFVDFTVSR